MGKYYSRINWKDDPNTATPLSAENLNKMDKALEDLDNAAESQEQEITNLKSEIGRKTEEQQNQIDTMKNNTADAFDETKTYAVGNYCIYNNVLYKCKTAVTEAGPWNEYNWAITTVEAEISKLKTTMEREISELNSNFDNIYSIFKWNIVTINLGDFSPGQSKYSQETSYNPITGYQAIAIAGWEFTGVGYTQLTLTKLINDGEHNKILWSVENTSATKTATGITMCVHMLLCKKN